MKLRLISMFVAMGAFSAWVAACNVQQGRPVCLVSHGGYAAKYIFKSADGAGACASKKGEVLAVEKYNAPSDPVNQIFAIQPGTFTDHATSGTLYATGPLDTTLGGDPDKDNFCTVPTMGAVTNPTDTLGNVGYHFTNVKFYVTPRIPGTQFSASLAYSEGGCTANYDVIALYPAIPCDDGSGAPDPTACKAGNGINPDFPQECDPDTLLCRLPGNTIPQINN